MLALRRVHGKSMEPCLRAGQLIVVRTRFFTVRPGDIVIIQHKGIEKIKRVASLTDTAVEVRGDNLGHSTDSRHFGPLPRNDITGKLLTFAYQK